VTTGLPGVLRVKGFFWLASRPDDAGLWSQAGDLLTVEYARPWGEGPSDDESDEEVVSERCGRSWCSLGFTSTARR